ncbi:MAG: glycosyltransferase [Actinobacteria bacterium]|nr:glycosyltransferase [Actinomycetota bacterium]
MTIGIPVFKGATYLTETVESVLAQSYRHWQVYFAIDGPDAACEQICREFTSDARFRVQVHDRRLGWLRNVGWLQDRADTGFWCCLPQDDLLADTYLEALIDRAMTTPDAAVTYCDIEGFGERAITFARPSVLGSPAERLSSFIREHFAGVAFRGLTRVEAIKTTGGGIISNDVADFAADTIWAAAMATWGDLVRVPQTLYRKRYHAANVHQEWAAWDLQTRTAAWVAHCHDLLDVATKVALTPSEKWQLWDLMIDRLIRSRATEFLPWAELGDDDRVAMVDALLTRCHRLDRVSLGDWLVAPDGDVRRRAMTTALEPERLPAPSV